MASSKSRFEYHRVFQRKAEKQLKSKERLWKVLQNAWDNTGWNDKIVVLKKTTLQLNFKTFIEKINSGNLIM